MAMVWQGPKSRAALLSESLGNSLGEGLANFTGNYFANQKLESIMSDPQYKDKPLEEKWQAMQRGLGPYGNFGKEAMQRQLQIDEKREQRKSANLRSSAFNKIMNKQQLTPQEEQALTPEDRLGIAKHEQALEIAQLKAGGKKTQAAQPIDPDQMQRIDAVRNNPAYQDASPSKKYQLLTNAGVSKENAKAETDIFTEEEKNKSAVGKREIDIHKLSTKVDEDIAEKAKSADRQLEAISTIRKTIRSGNVKPKSIANALRGFGVVGDKIADAYLNEDQAAFAASIPSLIEGMKDLFGVRLSDADLRIVQDKLPALGKDPKANEAILEVIEKYANLGKKRGEIARQVKKESQGLRKLDFADEVENRLERWKLNEEGFVEMISPSGKVVKIPKDQVENALNAGGKLANE
jgi:hypothetical protein